MTSTRLTVLFACVHNAGRSLMAAAFFNQLADPKKAQALSAGTQPGKSAHPEVVTVMRQVRVDLSTAVPRLLTPEVAHGSQWLITMGCGESCPVVPGARREDWPLDDPKGQSVDSVRVPMAWIVRTQQEPQRLNTAFQRELEQASQGLPVARTRSMEDIASQSTARMQFIMSLMITFAASALLLAAVGVYGVTTYAVQQRTHEIGVRLAMGATAGQVRRMLMAQSLRWALAGVTIGIVGAWGVARLLAAALFGVTAHDPVTFVGGPLALAMAALVAVWIP